MKYVYLLVTALLAASCDASRILCLMPIPGRSHTIVVQALCQELARRDFKVTAVTAYPVSSPPPNYKQVSISDLAQLASDHIDVFSMRKFPMALMLPMLMDFGTTVCEDVLSHPNVVELLNSDEKFDLILTEAFMDESIFAGVAVKYKAPLVLVGMFMPNLWTNNMVGNPAPYSYIPDPMLGFDTRMTFIERTINTVYGIAHELVYKLWYLPRQDKIMRKHFGDDLPPLDQLIRNVSLVLVNHHFSLGYTRPYVPNMVEVGGMHVGEPKPLPKDLQEFMDNAKEGVILFSLGSNVQSSKMPEDRLKVILEVFRGLKMKVLWKWETDNLPNKPDNVRISKWLPRTDILAHPNLKLFITHGGLGSITESTYRGVPILGIPIFAEQPVNIRQAELAGVGKKLELDDMTVDNFRDSIQEVLENPKYKEAVLLRSKLFKDTPMSAMDTAVYWIKYVLRHKGAHHMRSAAQDLSWWQLQLIDVIAVISAVLLVFSTVMYMLARACFRKICGKSKKQTQKKVKKN